MNCPKCKKENTVGVYDYNESCMQVLLHCVSCYWESETLNYYDFPHRSDCDCLKCDATRQSTERRRQKLAQHAANYRIQWYGPTPDYGPKQGEEFLALTRKAWGIKPLNPGDCDIVHTIPEGYPHVIKARIPSCDCGAEVAKSTHADWCSGSNKK